MDSCRHTCNVGFPATSSRHALPSRSLAPHTVCNPPGCACPRTRRPKGGSALHNPQPLKTDARVAPAGPGRNRTEPQRAPMAPGRPAMLHTPRGRHAEGQIENEGGAWRQGELAYSVHDGRRQTVASDLQNSKRVRAHQVRGRLQTKRAKRRLIAIAMQPADPARSTDSGAAATPACIINRVRASAHSRARKAAARPLPVD